MSHGVETVYPSSQSSKDAVKVDFRFYSHMLIRRAVTLSAQTKRCVCSLWNTFRMADLQEISIKQKKNLSGRSEDKQCILRAS